MTNRKTAGKTGKYAHNIEILRNTCRQMKRKRQKEKQTDICTVREGEQWTGREIGGKKERQEERKRKEKRKRKGGKRERERDRRKVRETVGKRERQEECERYMSINIERQFER